MQTKLAKKEIGCFDVNRKIDDVSGGLQTNECNRQIKACAELWKTSRREINENMSIRRQKPVLRKRPYDPPLHFLDGPRAMPVMPISQDEEVPGSGKKRACNSIWRPSTPKRIPP